MVHKALALGYRDPAWERSDENNFKTGGSQWADRHTAVLYLAWRDRRGSAVFHPVIYSDQKYTS